MARRSSGPKMRIVAELLVRVTLLSSAIAIVGDRRDPTPDWSPLCKLTERMARCFESLGGLTDADLALALYQVRRDLRAYERRLRRCRSTDTAAQADTSAAPPGSPRGKSAAAAAH